MNSKSPFKCRHFPPEIILWGVRWYCLYPISYRQLEEMMCDRGVEVDHSTLSRWVQKYAPELDKRCRSYLKPTNDSWRVDETYIKAECRRGKLPPPNLLVKGEDRYLYRAVDSDGNTLDFLLTAKRDALFGETVFPQDNACDLHSITASD